MAEAAAGRRREDRPAADVTVAVRREREANRVRVYLPATTTVLQRLLDQGRLEGPLTVFTVTPQLRSFYELSDGDEELEYAALIAAAIGGANTAALAEITDYKFELVDQSVQAGPDKIIAVRLIICCSAIWLKPIFCAISGVISVPICWPWLRRKLR